MSLELTIHHPDRASCVCRRGRVPGRNFKVRTKMQTRVFSTWPCFRPPVFQMCGKAASSRKPPQSSTNTPLNCFNGTLKRPDGRASHQLRRGSSCIDTGHVTGPPILKYSVSGSEIRSPCPNPSLDIEEGPSKNHTNTSGAAWALSAPCCQPANMRWYWLGRASISTSPYRPESTASSQRGKSGARVY